jgi:hypothetical protein
MVTSTRSSRLLGKGIHFLEQSIGSKKENRSQLAISPRKKRLLRLRNSKSKSERRGLQKRRDSLRSKKRAESLAPRLWLRSKGSLMSNSRKLLLNNKRERNLNFFRLNREWKNSLGEIKKRDLERSSKVLQVWLQKLRLLSHLALKDLI